MRHAIKSALSLVFVMAMAAAPAMAKDHGRDHGRDRDKGRYSNNDRGDDRYDSRDRYESHGHDKGYSNSREYRDNRYYRPAPPRVVYRPVYRPAYGHPAYGHAGYGPPPWVRGGRYYGDGYRTTYVVNDYRGYGLRAPPRGYYWRRSEVGDYLLVAAATGIIADLILRH